MILLKNVFVNSFKNTKIFLGGEGRGGNELMALTLISMGIDDL